MAELGPTQAEGGAPAVPVPVLRRKGASVYCTLKVPHEAARWQLSQLGVYSLVYRDEFGGATYECRSALDALAVEAFLAGADWRFEALTRSAAKRARSKSPARGREGEPSWRRERRSRARFEQREQRRAEEGVRREERLPVTFREPQRSALRSESRCGQPPPPSHPPPPRHPPPPHQMPPAPPQSRTQPPPPSHPPPSHPPPHTYVAHPPQPAPCMRSRLPLKPPPLPPSPPSPPSRQPVAAPWPDWRSVSQMVQESVLQALARAPPYRGQGPHEASPAGAPQRHGGGGERDAQTHDGSPPPRSPVRVAADVGAPKEDSGRR